MALLSLSRHLTFHARGDAAFVWHGLTGDVAEMSRDVLALMLAYAPAAEQSVVEKAPPAGLTRQQVQEFSSVLRARRFLVLQPAGGQKPDELSPLLAGFPRVPRAAIFERAAGAEGQPPQITVYARSAALPLDPVTSALFEKCNGERTLGQVLGDAGPQALEPLLRLCRADVAALKLLAKRVSEGGVQLNPAADSTMPYPELPDVKAYAAGGPAPGVSPHEVRSYHAQIADAQKQFDETETTLAHLFREPHPALKGRTFGQALAMGLVERGALRKVKGRKAVVLEVGGGLGFLGRALRGQLEQQPECAAGITLTNLDLSPALAKAQQEQGLRVTRGDALRLPVKPESLDLIVCNEMAGDLGTGPESIGARAAAQGPEGASGEPLQDQPPPRMVNHGALQLVREAAAALAPGGVLYLSEFGDPKGEPVRSDHLDHDEWSIRFADLQAEATRLGLGARVLPLAEVLGLDTTPLALSTTRASFAALKQLFAAHGLALTKRAWLRSEIEALCEGKLDLSQVHGLQWAPLSERTLGLVTKQFWCLIATKKDRVLH
jgi:SAM-dependent methyltransferase